MSRGHGEIETGDRLGGFDEKAHPGSEKIGGNYV